MKLDPVTAFYSSMPGGLSEMVLGGGEKGGNTAAISVIHGTRVLIIVMIIPFGYSFWSGHAIDRAVQLGGSILEFQWDDALILSLCLGFGVLFARWIHLPASNLVGPMLMSGVVHLAGFTDARPPNEIVAIAQIIVGTAIGARFSGIKTADVVRYMGYSIGSTLLMVFVATIMASLIFFIGVGESYFNILLGLVPGGLAEMSLIALSLNLEVAFVSSHHIVRIFLVVLLAPLLLSFVRPQDGSRNNETTK
jgi:membrane AbrB-like protein